MNARHAVLMVGLLAWQQVAPRVARAQGAAPTPPASPTSHAATPIEEEFRALIQARVDGRLPGDSASIDRSTAPLRTCVDEKGELSSDAKTVARARPPRPVPEQHPWTPHFVIDDVSVQRIEDVAVVVYRSSVRMVLNDEPVLKQWRRTEVFHRSDGAWQSVAAQETVIPGVITPVRVDVSRYDAYVGRYQLFPGYEYTVSRQGDRLMFHSRAVGDRELLPETATSFVERGLLYRVLFMPDSATGFVSRMRLREFPGVEYDAIRIK